MAKKSKKKKAKKKTASKRTAKKKPTKKKSAAKKKPTAKKSAPGKTTKSKTSGPRGTSVDNVLKKFEKERAAHDSQLNLLRKKIEELERKTRAFEEQISKLRGEESTTLDAIAQLDTRRDEEVSEMLSKLGVSLGSSNSPSYSSPPSSYDDDAADDDAADDDADSVADDDSESKEEAE